MATISPGAIAGLVARGIRKSGDRWSASGRRRLNQPDGIVAEIGNVEPPRGIELKTGGRVELSGSRGAAIA